MRRIMFLVGLILCIMLGESYGQTSTMSFTEDSWDFGTIKEEGGKVSHTFEFTNKGTKPFVIEHVATTCGCTTPKYSKEPILPGKKGTIQITYDPDGRPGPFRREVTIISNGRTNRNVLTIKGDVTARPRSVEDDYPVALTGGMRVNRTSPAMGYVARGNTKSIMLELVNTSQNNVKLGIVYDKPSPYFKAEFASAEVKPGGKAPLTLTYNLKSGNLWGMLSDKFFITVNGEKCNIPFVVTGIATDDFSGMTREEFAVAPRAALQSQFYHFGDVKKGVERSREFVMTNQGEKPLIIRNVSGNGNISTDLKEGTVIEPGGQKSFTVTLNTEGATSGKYMRSLVIILNDPQRPMREIRLAATIL